MFRPVLVRGCRPTHLRFAASVVLVLALTTSPALSQTTGSATIQGKVTDETGGVLPGVTATLTSPALQVPQLLFVTDAGGMYRFVDLRPGVYRISYELTGFQTVVRQGLRINAGFVATVDVVMKVGTVEESITVSGQSPVVDVVTTTGTTNFTKEMLSNAPVVMTMWQVLAMTPGIRFTSTPDVGGSTLGTQQGYSNYGTSGMVKPQLDGIDTRESTGSAGTYYDDRTAEEVEVKSVGNDAEMALRGTNYVSIIKSGGNEFHGNYYGAFENKKIQLGNIDAELKSMGVGLGEPINYYYDVSADLGGRIVRDKLWFYGAYRNQRTVNTVAGFASATGPDKVYGTADDVLADQLNGLINYTLKLSYQPSEKFKAIALGMHMDKDLPNRGGDRYRPAENSWDFTFPTDDWKVEVQGMPTDRILWNVLVGKHYQNAHYFAQESADVPGNPTRYNRTTQIYTGAAQNHYQRTQFRWQSSGSISYFPTDFLGGSHSFKGGYRVTNEWYGIQRGNKESGNYMLTYDLVGGVLQGVEIQTQNSPIVGLGSRMTEVSGFFKDTWQIGRRLTLNPGVRFERYHSWVSEQTKIQGQFGESGTFPKVDVLTWFSWAPRFGLAYDVTGDAKTVAKTTLGWYNDTMGQDYAVDYNRNYLISTRYRWRDLNGNRDYDRGEVNLDVNGPDFISISGATNNINNPDLEQPRTYEYTAGLDRELMANFSARVLYVYKRMTHQYNMVNVLRPYSAWAVPITRTDPGPDGTLGTADDGAPVTFYDYPSAYRGAAFVGNKNLNRPPGRDNSFQTIEVTLNKRPSQHWDMLASFSATKNHAYVSNAAANPNSPNDEVFPLDTTWSWMFKALGGCDLPYEIRIGGFYQAISGGKTERSYVFRSVPQASTVTLRLEPRGSQREPFFSMLNFRVSRVFKLGGSRQVNLLGDVFNVFNANTIDAVSYVSGPTFGRPSGVLPPLIVRFGVEFRF